MTGATPWQEWREEAAEMCAVPLVQRLAALLDRDPAPYRIGGELPQGWHMILFTPTAPQSALGADGHPTGQAQFAPPGLPRRMLGGRRTRFDHAVTIGSDLRRVSRIAGVEEKQGRTGRLAVVTIRHAITETGRSDPAIVEEQDIIYREAASGPAPPVQSSEPEREQPLHARSFTPDPALLFRYSAVTFNAHRIHYDQPYATGPEGYPGLVVNGGLTALLLLEMLKDVAGRPLRSMDVRNRRPLICGRQARLCVSPAGDGWVLWAEDEQGRVALEAGAA